MQKKIEINLNEFKVNLDTCENYNTFYGKKILLLEGR